MLDVKLTQERSERIGTEIGVADGEEGKRHAPPSSRIIEGATLMGRDVIGLVASDLILRIILRRVMGMALVIEVAEVDGDDGSRYPAGLGIPAYMIADFKFPSHGVVPVFPEIRFSAPPYHCAPRHGHCRQE
jgi:hypothetical protein